jgi:hypothetical protein
VEKRLSATTVVSTIGVSELIGFESQKFVYIFVTLRGCTTLIFGRFGHNKNKVKLT